MLYMCRPVYLFSCLPADHGHVEICIYKTFNVPTCLMYTCLPAEHEYVEFLFTKLSMCGTVYLAPVHLSTCLPVYHVHVKVKLYIYNTYMSTKDEFLFSIINKKNSPSKFRYSLA